MARPKGLAKTGGRKPGSGNRLTIAVKNEFEFVFAELQKEQHVNLFQWAKANPTEFYKLSSKLIPTDLNAKIMGDVSLLVTTADA